MRDADMAANSFLASKNILATFICQGGATTQWLWNVELDRQFDCIVIAIGSNELSSCTIEQLQDRLNDFGRHLIHNGYTNNIIIMGLWPRKSPSFSVRAQLFNKLSRRRMYWCAGILFWEWSKKLTFRFSDDVHLTKNSYRRALKYVISPIQCIFPYDSK